MNKSSVFLDTNGWLALLNASDFLHGQARSCWEELNRVNTCFVVSDWVIAETGNGLARTAARANFARAVELMLSSPRVEVVWVDEALARRALALYQQRNDKTWGLVDFASFLVMQDRSINRAFTTDHHFEQAGFVRLLSTG